MSDNRYATRRAQEGLGGGHTDDRAENRLLALAERLRRHKEGRVALHIHLSRLQARHRREHHVRVAASTFESVVRQHEGQIFILRNSDIFFVGKGISKADLEDAVIRLRYLFSEDPIIQYSGDLERGDFCTWYDLERNYEAFLVDIQRMQRLTDAQAGGGELFGEPSHPSMTVSQLAELERVLTSADISSLIRNQTVCAIAPNKEEVVPVFFEIYVSMRDVAAVLLPNVDVTAQRWLFMHLTETLDRRVLALLRKDASQMSRAFSLNLNISTILSGDFQRFDELINSNLRGKLVVEMQAVDLFADIGAFMFAREYLRDRGYRICLDGLTHYTFPIMDRERLQVDLLKIHWSDVLDDRENPQGFADLKRVADRSGTARIILSRCDTARAIEIGQQAGVALFQGRIVDKLMRDGTKAALAGAH